MQLESGQKLARSNGTSCSILTENALILVGNIYKHKNYALPFTRLHLIFYTDLKGFVLLSLFTTRKGTLMAVE